MSAELLAMRGIAKSFGGIQALKGVDFSLGSREIRGLVGENGAGKSTLMRIMSGIERPDSGSIAVEGREARIDSPRHAQELGIAMIPQELLLVQELSVSENVFFGYELTGALGMLRKAEMRERTKRILADLHCESIDPDARMSGLPKAEQQLVAIARRIAQGGKVFVMDEPTAALTEKETRFLFRIIRSMCDAGSSIVFISHRLEEVQELCDRVTVLRDGAIAATLERGDGIDKQGLIFHMVGNRIAEEYPHTASRPGKPVLEAASLSYSTFQGRRVEGVSFEVRESEVVGITGLVGAGKTELCQVLMGLRKPSGGALRLDGREVSIDSPVQAVGRRFGYVSEDRRNEGLILRLDGMLNMSLSSLKKISRRSFISRRKERELVSPFLGRLSMKSAYLTLDTLNLSGGNQQKVVIVRQMASNARVVIFDEPTNGIDVGAKAEVSRIIGDLAAEGKAVILCSSEPREVLGVSDRIYVLGPKGMQGPYGRGELDYARLMSIEFGGEAGEAK